MKRLKFFLSASMLFLIATNSCSQQKSEGSSKLLGVFVASTPCSQGTRPLPGIQANAGCELIKWKLTLYQETSTKASSRYELHCIYGLPKQGTTGFIGGGTKIKMEGKWTIIKDAGSNQAKTIYRLSDTKTSQSISFLKLNDDLLHLLDNDQHLMIGTAAWSYTFNRIDNK